MNIWESLSKQHKAEIGKECTFRSSLGKWSQLFVGKIPLSRLCAERAETFAGSLAVVAMFALTQEDAVLILNTGRALSATIFGLRGRLELHGSQFRDEREILL